MKRFPSIKKNSQFQKVYRNGVSYANRLLVMYVMANGEDGNQIGISVSKKVGNSVVRHHITRLLREIFRLNGDRLKTGLNIVLVVRGAARESDYKHLEGAYLHLCGLCLLYTSWWYGPFLPGSVRWSGEEWPSYPCTGT